MSPEHHEHRQKRFARIRRAKWFLRFMPRRARLHHYPLIGRFADFARQRDYLWSFRIESVRPALYVGSIIALLPLLGIQVAVAFGLALLTRANVMLLVGLQFITTPFTALPIYYGTYYIGSTVVAAVGMETTAEVLNSEEELIQELESLDESISQSNPVTPRQWGNAIIAMMVGGLICGVILGGILDLIWRFVSGRLSMRRVNRIARKIHSGSTPPDA